MTTQRGFCCVETFLEGRFPPTVLTVNFCSPSALKDLFFLEERGRKFKKIGRICEMCEVAENLISARGKGIQLCARETGHSVYFLLEFCG